MNFVPALVERLREVGKTDPRIRALAAEVAEDALAQFHEDRELAACLTTSALSRALSSGSAVT